MITKEQKTQEVETLECESMMMQVYPDNRGNKVKEYLVNVIGKKCHRVKVVLHARVAGTIWYKAVDADMIEEHQEELYGSSYVSEAEAIKDLLNTIY